MSEHGTRAHYVMAKCRCDSCRNANRVDQATRERSKLYGRYNPFVDAQPVREHVLALSAAGVGRRRLAELAGVSETAIQTLKTGTADRRDHRPPARIRRETAENIMAVQLGTVTHAPRALVDARGAQRRIQALAARGWSHKRFSAELGLTGNNVHQWLTRTHVTRETADAIAKLYEQLWDKQPPIADRFQAAGVSRTINHARKLGWLPPAAWDDIDTDPEPPAVETVGEVDEIAIELATRGQPVKLSSIELRIATKQLHRRGVSAEEIARLLRVSSRTVVRIRREFEMAS